MWNDAPESKYHILPIIVLPMHVMRVKSSSNCEAEASHATPFDVFLLAFLCEHFMA